MSTIPALTYSVLGPLQVHLDGVPVELGYPQQRAVLAALLVDAGRVVPADVVAERVWAERASSAGLHACISRLRRALEPAIRAGAWTSLRTQAPGYRLVVERGAVDALVFTDAVTRARGQHERGELVAARATLQFALDLWRGHAYADVGAPFATAEATRLEELRLDAVELAARVDLGLGRHAHLLERLPALVRAQPLRESLRGCLMLALYRSGRPAEALQQYATLRELLADELGADPCRELQALHERMLRQDPGLDLPPARRTVPVAPRPVAARPARERACALDVVRRHGVLLRAPRPRLCPTPTA